MRIKFRYILLFLLTLIPFVKVDALRASTLTSTEPKEGYRCYMVCKTSECRSKITLYTNRDMSDVKTMVINITYEGTKEEIQDDNLGINLFANTIQYPDENIGVLHNISQYYSHAIDGRFGESEQEAIEYIKNGIIEKQGEDKYDEVIEKFSSYDENSDISPYACLIAGETVDLANNFGGSLYTDNYKFVYEYSYSGRSLYNLSYYDDNDRPNLNNWLLLEGGGFFELSSTQDIYGNNWGGWVNFQEEDILEIPELDSSEMEDVMNDRNYNISKKEKEKINDTIIAANAEIAANGSLTHDKLIQILNCIEVNHDLNEVEQQCKAEFDAAGKKTKGKEWKQCLKDKGYVWYGVCDPGFTFGVLPQLENAEIAQQESIDSAVDMGNYVFIKAAFEFMASGTGISCYNIRFATFVWRAICILGPFLFIIFGSLDFIKAIMASDEKAQTAAKKKLPKRIVAFVLFLILPVIVRLIFSFGQYNSGNLGLLKCIVTFDTTSTDPVYTSKNADLGDDESETETPTEKKKCEEYKGTACPNVDGYGNKCLQKLQEGSTSILECTNTGEKAKKCTDYTMSTCPKKDDYLKACELVKQDGSSTPVCDYKK